MSNNIPNRPYTKQEHNGDYESFKKDFVKQFKVEPEIFNEEIRHIDELANGRVKTYFFDIKRSDATIPVGKQSEEAFYKKGKKSYSDYIARKQIKVWLENHGANFSCYFGDNVSISYSPTGIVGSGKQYETLCRLTNVPSYVGWGGLSQTQERIHNSTRAEANKEIDLLESA